MDTVEESYGRTVGTRTDRIITSTAEGDNCHVTGGGGTYVTGGTTVRREDDVVLQGGTLSAPFALRRDEAGHHAGTFRRGEAGPHARRAIMRAIKNPYLMKRDLWKSLLLYTDKSTKRNHFTRG